MPGCWAWWPHPDDHVQRSSPGPLKPACRVGQPPHTCPGRHTGSPGCAGFSGELESHSLLAVPQQQLHCCVGAALWGNMHMSHVKGNKLASYMHTIPWLQKTNQLTPPVQVYSWLNLTNGCHRNTRFWYCIYCSDFIKRLFQMSIDLTSLTMLLFIIGEEVIQGILWCFTILLLLLRLENVHRAVFSNNSDT